ncbi:MAG: NfeD family protein, partial [Acidimicrobiales bacterium]
LVVRVDSTAGVISDRAAVALAERVRASPVPVAVWVGPDRGARAYGPAFRLLEAATMAGAAPGTRVGESPSRSAPAATAAEVGILDVVAPTLGDLLIQFNDTARLGIPTEVVERPGRPPQQRLAPAAVVRFSEPGLVAQLLHAVASPSVAFGLLVVALCLMVLEFFTAGTGVAAATAVPTAALSAYGLAALGARPLALALVVVGVFGFAVDVQAGAPRAWTAIGTLAVAAASRTLYRDGLAVPLWAAGLLLVGVAIFMVAGLPALLRSRFATPTIGRQSMIGEMGSALTPVNPEGTVSVRDAPWRARTNRATPISAGAPVRVVGIDGLVLEVEPETGGAREAHH